MEELGEILRGKIVDGLESEKQDLVNDAIFDGEPMKLLQDRCYVTDGVFFSNDTGCRVLYQLSFMYGLSR